ncbi:MAG: Crp/Fnr family transcriptional regulator [Spirochaetota bacterium]
MVESKENLERLLANDSWLRQFFTHAPSIFLRQLELVEMESEKRIISKGEANPYIYILYDGSIRIINEFGNNRIFSFATKEAPGFSGLLEFLSGQDIATSSVETMKPSRFIRIRKRIFAQWMEGDIHAFRLVVKTFAKQLYPSLFSMGEAYVYPKYHSLVGYLFRSYGQLALTQGMAKVQETREELSDVLGFSHRTVYRLCRRLADDGYAKVVKKKLCIGREQIQLMKTYLENESYERIT